MKDPYALIRELIFKYKGRPKSEVEKAVLDAFREAYGIYLPDLGVPYEELVHYIQIGSEDEACDWLESYLYDYLLREYESELKAEEEFARVLGEKLLEYLKSKGKKLLTPNIDPSEYIHKLLEDYSKLQSKYKELQKELAKLKKQSAKAELSYEKGKTSLTKYLEIARATEEATKKLKEELERLKKENEQLREKIKLLERVAKTPELIELKKVLEDLPKEAERISKEVKQLEEEEKKEISLYERLKEHISRERNTANLVDMYYNVEKYYPGYSPEEYEAIRRLILSELKRRNWYFCPVHGKPLMPKPFLGVLYLVCPEGDMYRLKDHKLVPISLTEVQRIRRLLGLGKVPTPPAPAVPPIVERIEELPEEMKEKWFEMAKRFLETYGIHVETIEEAIRELQRLARSSEIPKAVKDQILRFLYTPTVSVERAIRYERLPARPPMYARAVKEKEVSPELIKSIINDLKKFGIEIPETISIVELKMLLGRLRTNTRIPKYIRDRITSYYWLLR